MKEIDAIQFMNEWRGERDDLIKKTADHFAGQFFEINEFKTLFYHRAKTRMMEFYSMFEMLLFLEFKHEKDTSRVEETVEENIGEIMIQICNDEKEVFLGDIHVFKKRNGEDIEDVIKRAGGGDTEAICKLVEWDKTCLSFDFIHKSISINQLIQDTDFFERLAKSIRKKSNIQSKAKEKDLIKMARFYKYVFKDSLDFPKEMLEVLRRIGKFDDEDDILPLDDLDYFRKYLKRHKII